eukprot:4960893-Pyramimonas_sp.AAC.1
MVAERAPLRTPGLPRRLPRNLFNGSASATPSSKAQPRACRSNSARSKCPSPSAVTSKNSFFGGSRAPATSCKTKPPSMLLPRLAPPTIKSSRRLHSWASSKPPDKSIRDR